MIRTNFFLTEEQLKGLRERSEKSGLSVAEIVRRIIDAHLEKTRDLEIVPGQKRRKKK
jgi:predicted DNA-binding protein